MFLKFLCKSTGPSSVHIYFTKAAVETRNTVASIHFDRWRQVKKKCFQKPDHNLGTPGDNFNYFGSRCGATSPAFSCQFFYYILIT